MKERSKPNRSMIMWMMKLSIITQISKWPILEKWDMGPICGTIFSLGSDSPWYIMYIYKQIKVTLVLGSWSGSEFRSLIFKFGCKYTALESVLHEGSSMVSKLSLGLGHFWAWFKPNMITLAAEWWSDKPPDWSWIPTFKRDEHSLQGRPDEGSVVAYYS